LEGLIEFLHHQKIAVILSSYPVLISPENLQEYLEIFLDHRRFYIELSLVGIIDASFKFNDVIKAIANEYSIGFIDNSSGIAKNTKYFADNVHYTDEGARLVALNFANYIKKRWVH
jgi:lysophospholipase L1-like esterase